MKDIGQSESGGMRTHIADWYRNGLSARLIIVLSLVLLPLALVATLQTQRAIEAGEASFRASLAAQTAAAAQPERAAILEAFGVATSLAKMMTVLDPAEDDCSRIMQDVAAAYERFAFVGFTGTDRRSLCNSFNQAFDFSGSAESDRLFADPKSDVTFNPSGGASETAVVIVSEPAFEADGDLKGFASISLPALPLVAQRSDSSVERDLKIVTFNSNGLVLTSDFLADELDGILPLGTDLADLAGSARRVFTQRDRRGEMRDYALVSIIPTSAYALGTAPSGRTAAVQGVYGALMFPFAMWLVSLLVAVLMLRRQVIVPIRQLRMRMRSFADGRAILAGDTMGTAPRELREIGETFDTMAEQILRDEAELENRVHERELLLREVHHRVKNNLQLMSSIINMQIRQSSDPEAEEALRRVQGRLASLAKFHRDLYKSSALSNLQADTLLEDLARQLMTVALDPARPIDLQLDLDSVVMSPDQASPLAMLVTEAMTNAIKYAATETDSRPFVRLGMSLDDSSDPNMVRVVIENSVPARAVKTPEAGLGTQLIRAFAVQLDAKVEKRIADGRFALDLSFALEPFRVDGTGPTI